MMIRSMSPEVMVVDEIGGKKDVDALSEAIHSGVTIICSIHGSSLETIKNRPLVKYMLQSDMFKRFIVLGKRSVFKQRIQIYDESGHKIKTFGDGWT